MIAKNMKSTDTPPLEDRIRRIRADIEAIVDAKARVVAKQSPGVPLGVIRNVLTARAGLSLRAVPRDRGQGVEVAAITNSEHCGVAVALEKNGQR